MSVVVDFQDVTVIRSGRRLIDSVTWQVEEGQRWAVMGPNGAGKSTLLSIAAARLHPTSGTVDLLDEVLGAVDVFELRPRIGLSSAGLARQVPDRETVHDAVLTAAYGVTGRWKEQYEEDDSARVDQLLRAWGISRLSARRFGTLSDGERKRVLIARALMTDPELLLLDEPGAGMDIAGREDLVKRLSALGADPASPTSVLVTHHLEELPQHLTHLLLLNHGKVVAQGPLEEVLTSRNISRTYETPLEVTRVGGRYTAFAA